MKALRRVLIVLLACALVAVGALTYKRWPGLRKRVAQRSANPSETESLSSVPPFSTKEPERYQATRIITSVEYKDASGQAPLTTTSKTLIARDGDKRREEYKGDAEESLVYLETLDGHFILSPTNKLYADLNLGAGDPNTSKPESNADAGSVAPPGTPDFSPERLLNEKPTLAHYEKLGTETINERAATRYRVTPRDENNGNNAGSVTLIWIDDALSLPIRSETRSTAGDHPATLTMELRDLKETVDPRIFELPKDYRKVDYRRFFIESRLTPVVSGNERTASPKP